jgi:hypothetical protein
MMQFRIGCWLMVVFCSVQYASAQPTYVHIDITPLYGSQTLALAEAPFQSNDSNGLQIDVLKFYVSDFRFLKNNNIVLESKDLFLIIDASDPDSWNIDIPAKEDIAYDKVVFNLGIDSTTNVSGAMGGALDPSNGMYWTWQSGYINFKLEGKSKNCPAANNEFQFHLGGYQAPFNSLQTVSLLCKGKDMVRIYLDVKKILDHIDLASLHHVMSPGREAVSLSQIVAKAFSTASL